MVREIVCWFEAWCVQSHRRPKDSHATQQHRTLTLFPGKLKDRLGTHIHTPTALPFPDRVVGGTAKKTILALRVHVSPCRVAYGKYHIPRTTVLDGRCFVPLGEDGEQDRRPGIVVGLVLVLVVSLGEERLHQPHRLGLSYGEAEQSAGEEDTVAHHEYRLLPPPQEIILNKE